MLNMSNELKKELDLIRQVLNNDLTADGNKLSIIEGIIDQVLGKPSPCKGCIHEERGLECPDFQAGECNEPLRKVKEKQTVTFCEMHKTSRTGCSECPNRWVCDDSPLKVKK